MTISSKNSNLSVEGAWWGNFALSDEHFRHHQICDLLIEVTKCGPEWTINRSVLTGNQITSLEQGVVCPTSEAYERLPQDSEYFSRYIVSSEIKDYSLLPKLADRSVVSRTLTPLNILPKQQVVLYISTPLWISVTISKFDSVTDFPVFRPSDTWFGGNTLEGTLCYSARTNASLKAEEIPMVSDKAVTPVTITNKSSTNIQIDKINLPVPYLSVFTRSDNTLWTQPVSLTRDPKEDTVELKIEEVSLDESSNSRLICPPREILLKSTLNEAWSFLFG